MKFKIMLLALLAAFQMSAQSEVKLKLEYQPSDSTWFFTETVRVEGKKVSERVLPEDGKTLPKADFKTFTEALIKGEQNRLSELQRTASKVDDNIKFLGASLDSVCGARSFAALAAGSIKEKLQGPWTMVIRNGSQDFMTVNVQGDQMASKNASSTITWLGADSFRLNRPGIFAFNLTFKQVEPDRYLAERVVDGVTHKYTLRR